MLQGIVALIVLFSSQVFAQTVDYTVHLNQGALSSRLVLSGPVAKAIYRNLEVVESSLGLPDGEEAKRGTDIVCYANSSSQYHCMLSFNSATGEASPKFYEELTKPYSGEVSILIDDRVVNLSVYGTAAKVMYQALKVKPTRVVVLPEAPNGMNRKYGKNIYCSEFDGQYSCMVIIQVLDGKAQ